jgi:single stranded DNA-binding protein
MNNLNSVLLEGTMVHDPVITRTKDGTPACSFTLASSRYLKSDSGPEKETGIFRVEGFGNVAALCGKNGYEGRGVRVVGRLSQRQCNNENGEQYSQISIVTEHIEFRPDFSVKPARKNGLEDYEMER